MLKSRLIFLTLALAFGHTTAAKGLFETVTVFPTAPANKPNYRIPSLIQMKQGDLLAIVERRNDGIGDIGDHDIVMKRSRDCGKTWSDVIPVYNSGGKTAADITLCYDQTRDILFLFFLEDKKKFACLRSTDEGVTWQGPTLVHSAVIRPEWDALGGGGSGGSSTDAESTGSRVKAWTKNWDQRYGLGPGHAGIQLTQGPHAGRLLVPARHREEIEGKLVSFDHIIYSDDHGATWHLGPNITRNGTETQLLELANGDVLASIRDGGNAFAPDRMKQFMAVSRDGGMSWGTARPQPELITPGVHASLKRYSLAGEEDKNRLLFSNPAHAEHEKKHPYGRYNLTVRLSYDEGQTWSAGKTIYPYPSSYSDLARLKDGTIGLIYERGPQGSDHYWDELQFARFDLGWLTDGADSPARN